MISQTTLELLEKDLDHFDPTTRSNALEQLAGYVNAGELKVPPVKDVANMHCHTFFSYNAYGYSPSGLAWLAKKSGYRMMGIVDFDVLDGVDEFLNACELLGIAASAGLETRNYLPEFAGFEINSPGEPGVYYNMAIGFTTSDVPPQAKAILDDLKLRSDRRNRSIIERVNDYLFPIRIDYNTDVLPLTPAGSPTERHIVLAYLGRVNQEFDDPSRFWADRLGLSQEQTAALIQDSPHFQNIIRSKLMKRGGAGYVQPDPASFPVVDQLYTLATISGALPCATWLDGFSGGEKVFPEILELLVSKGAAALNIVPDRNWNIADGDLKQAKLEKLYEVVQLAESMDLPLNIGTEMNTYGNKLVDDFHVPELAPVRKPFLDGAFFIYGHTILQRALGLGYESDWARSYFPRRRERVQFFTRVGNATPPGRLSLLKLREIGTESTPAEILSTINQRENTYAR